MAKQPSKQQTRKSEVNKAETPVAQTSPFAPPLAR